MSSRRLAGLVLPHARWKIAAPGDTINRNPFCNFAIKRSACSIWILFTFLIFQSLILPVDAQDGDKKYFRIEENLPVGQLVGVVDSTSGHTYELATDTIYFRVERLTGQIRIQQIIDREQLTSSEIKFVVKKISSSSLQTLIEVIVTIIDLNDNDPRFTSKFTNYTITENDVPMQPFTLTANDPDSLVNGSSSVTYSILSGNEEGYWNINTSSAIGPKHGLLRLSREVDREEIDSFRFVIEARDGGSPSRTGTIIVNILVRDLNDNHPKFDFSKYQAEVLENATIGTVVLQTLAQDLDSGINSALVFSMESNKLFTIDSATGEISLQDSLMNEGYSIEDTCESSYCNTTLCLVVCLLEIQVRDQENAGTSVLSDQSQVTITIQDINDHAPVIGGGREATVSEDIAIDRVVFTLSVKDNDKVGSVNGQIDLNYVSGNELGHFKNPSCIRIDGGIHYCFIKTNASVDKEKVSTYNLTFVATDRGLPPLRSTASVILTVLDANDHSPVFSASSYSAVISELDPVNSFVAAVTATDADEDENGRITYRISNGNNDQFLKIDGDSGLITVNRRVDSDNLQTPRLTLNISASDHGSRVLRTEVTLTVDIIDENDEVPTFTQSEYDVEVVENNNVNMTLLTMSANDRDKGANGSVRYSISAESTRMYPGLFYIGSVSGELIVTRSLDREQQSDYMIGVVAHDMGTVISLSSEVNVYINVTDDNDNRPVFYPTKYHAVVPETAGIRFSVLTVTATDPDDGDNGVVRYSLSQQSGANGKFSIDSQTGELSVSGALSDSDRTYNIQVDAVDIPGKSAQAIVEVKVANPAESDPEFEQQTYTFSVFEDAEGTLPSFGTVGTVKANAGTVVKYFIVDGDPNNVFTINQNNGTINTIKALDRDAVPAYHLTVVAVGFTKVGYTSVNITLRDRNDNSPVFGQQEYEVAAAEDTPRDSVVFLAQAVDRDVGNNARITYTISASMSDRLVIDLNTGAVRLRRMIQLGETLRFTVTATDGGQDPRSGSARVVIRASDVNDHSPVFEQREYYIAVNESSIINTRFLLLTATDADLGANAEVTYSLVSGVRDTKPEFGVFPDGSLYVAQKLDREVKDRYELLVQAQDGGMPIRRTDSALVHVKILDANDNTPQFTVTSYEFRVLEGKSNGTYIGSVSARDADTGRNSDLMYFFTNTQFNFDLDPFTGEIRSRKEFDREDNSNYMLTVRAIDNGLTRHYSEASVRVIVEDVNDNSPTFSKAVYDIVISEDSQVGQMINPLTATDPDLDINGIVEYSIISGNEKGHFKMNQDTGSVAIDRALNRELQNEYELVVKATDTGVPPLSSNATLFIRLSDANDHSPTFESPSYSIDVKEDVEPGSLVGKVSASDADIGVNAIVQYSITQGNEEGVFEIIQDSGQIRLAKSLDYESKHAYTLTVRAANRPPQSLSAQTRLSINVLDVNDNSPRFIDDVVSAFLSENSTISTPVVRVTADDRDSGINGRVSYAIISQPTPEKFMINKGGQILTKATVDRENANNYEIKDEYTIVVEVTDQASPESLRLSARKTIIVTITDINDNAPEFISPKTGAVLEGSQRGTEVMTIQARDKDARQNAEIEYSLRSGTGYFSIDPSSGLITLLQSVSTSPVIHSITVRASDKGQPPKITEEGFQVILSSSVNSGLVFTQSSTAKNLLETVRPGTDVLQLSANEPNVEYYITKITSLGQIQPALFKMSSELGQMKTSMPLDRDEGYVRYTAEVYVRDKESNVPRTAKTDVLITLLDVNDSAPKFSSLTFNADCSENATTGYTVTTITATDADADPTVSYSISNSDGAFTIDNQGNVKVAGPLDRETTPRYTLTVTARDSTYHSTAELIITLQDVNDEPPEFSKLYYSFSVLETSAPNELVGSIVAIDSDLGVGGEVTYRILTTWGSELFSIDTETGLITLEGTLNFEDVQLYVLQVEAKDKDPNNPHKSNATIYINVLDENDNAPVFSPATYNPSILESVDARTPVVTVTAFDEDAGMNGRVHYSILTDDVPFVIDESNGTIYTSRLLDREDIDMYIITVQAQDLANTNSLSSSATVTITLEDYNDNDPKFVPPYTVHVDESVTVNTVIATLVANDLDTGINNEISYSLMSNNEVFSIDSTTGELKVLQRLDRETLASYDITVKAQDSGSPRRSSSAHFSVIVEDVNDNDPQFVAGQVTSLVVREDQAPGEVLLTISATDADTGLASTLRYYIISGDSNEDFHLDQFTGKLSVSRVLDYERIKAYTVTIQVEDLGPMSRFSTIDIDVTVTDWNDNPPVFLHSPYYVYLQEEATSLPVELLTVEAFDADSEVYNQTVYAIEFGLDDGAEVRRNTFNIGPTTGVISATRAVDREQTSSFTLKVRATNAVSGSSDLTGEATVHVIVRDINDHAPTFDLPIYSTNVVESEDIGQRIIQVTASDLDTGSNAQVRYTLVNDSVADDFAINSLTGWISNTVALNREESERYDLSVVAYDLGDVSQSSMSNVKIYIKDINDNSPAFTQDRFDIRLRDPSQSGDFVLGSTAVDPDRGSNGTVTYSLRGPNAAKFNLNPDTGVILAAQTLSGPNALTVTVRATDGGNRYTEIMINITFQSFSDAAKPVFLNSASSVQISEGQLLNTEITKVTANPGTNGGSVLYSIAGGNVGHTFSIKPNGGIVADKKIDYSRAARYDLWIEAKNADNGIKSFKNIQISIEDENDHVPEFDQALYMVSVEEQQSVFGSRFLVKVTASDPDSGFNGNITYSLVSGNRGNPFILSSDGSLRLTKELDRESIPRYHLVIRATDGGGLNSTTIVIVNVLDINDIFPRFESNYRWNVPEDVAVGSVVSAVRATDGDIGANANVVYSLAESSTHFEITSSGNVTVKASLDRETQATYSVVVSARNTGPENVISGTTTVEITVTDVNDNAPQFSPTSQYNFTFIERQPVGSVVAIINTTDRDSAGPNSLIRYQLVSPSSFFIIDQATGAIKSKAVMEFDVTGIHNTYVLYVEAQDSGVPSHTSIASVNITLLDANDHAPQFSQSSYFTAVPEDVDVSTDVLTVSAVDLFDYNVNALVSYSVIGGNGSSLFGIRSAEGKIFVRNSLVLKTDQYRTVRIKAEDQGMPPQSNVVAVTMLITPQNRYPPTWAFNGQLIFNVSEAEDPGYEITVIEATDLDSGINGQIIYSLNPGNEKDAGLFHINSATGRVTLTRRLDYERGNEYQMTLQAEDKAFISRLAYKVLKVNVIDADDNAPVFSQPSYVAEVSENLVPGITVSTVTARDADQGENAVVRYSIIGDSTSRTFFDIDPVTGKIITKTTFDYEVRNQYTLIIKAYNPNSDVHENIVHITVNVKGVNEFAPNFVSDRYTFDVSESANVGYVVGVLRATDEDDGIDGEPEFVLVAGSNNQGFSIGRTTGQLMVAETLDRESVEFIQLTALVKNPGPVQGNDTDTVTILVNLDDANDSPVFDSSVYNASVEENLSSITDVITVSARDTDQQAGNREFSYALQDDYNMFNINANNGKITTTQSLDRETENIYTLVVQAIDRGVPPLTGQAIVYVQVTDVNDNSPHFVPAVPEGEIVEGSLADTPVLGLTLVDFTFDDDVPPNRGPYRYSLTSPQFSIDENTGTVLTKTSNIDYESVKQYILSIRVSDSGGLASTLEAKVKVRDINDQPSTPRDLTIKVQAYGTTINGVIGSVEPLDVDLVGDYSCTLSSQPQFSIQDASCFLRAVELTSDTSMQVNGDDGIHSSVQSSVSVEVETFANQTLDAAIVTRVSGVTAEQFVSSSEAFLQSLDALASGGSKAKVLALRETGNYVDLYLVLEKLDGSYSSSIGDLITSNTVAIKRQTRLTIATPKRNVCTPSSCSGNGECRSQVVVDDQLDYTSTDSLTLSYHTASLVPMCTCDPEYIGEDCSEEAGACISSPCMNNARCMPIGETEYECECTPQWTGRQCQQDVDECQADREPACANGGTCTNLQGSHKCSCTEHFHGSKCEEPIRCENRNPCQNSATCIDLQPGGYECRCAYGFYGDLCQHSSYGFEEDSYLELPPLSETANDIKMTLATENMNALLLFQPGTGSEFMALQIANGSVVFTFSLDDERKVGITVSKGVSSGSWYRIHATRAPTKATLEVTFCNSPIECRNPCNRGVDCYTSIDLDPGSKLLRTADNKVSVGGVSSIEKLLYYANSIHSGSFLGCIGNLELDGEMVTLGQSLADFNVKDTCPRIESKESKIECTDTCGGPCHINWFSALCTCEEFYSQKPCVEALMDTDVSIGANSALTYSYKESYRRSKLLSTASVRRRREITASSSRLSLSIRTGADGVLMETEPGEASQTLQVIDGYLMYGDIKNPSVVVTDGVWHEISLIVTETYTLLTVDGKIYSENLTEPNDFLDLSVVSGFVMVGEYEGCVRDILLNGDRLPMSDGQTDKFEITVSGSDSVSKGCDGCPATVNVCGEGKQCAASGGTVSCVTTPEDPGMKPWLIAVVIVLSVVFVLAAIFAVVCIVNSCRRRKANKKGSTSTMKSNIITTERSRDGHDNLPDADILSSERPSTRSYNNMSPVPPPLQTSRTVPSPYQQLEDSTVIIEGSVTGGLNSSDKYNCDQFYDFDETASIAPSDVDIRKYYKGYRKGDNMEMQMIPKSMRQHSNRSQSRTSPIPHSGPRESPLPRQFSAPSPMRQSPLIMNGGYDSNRQETPISQLQQKCLRQTPIDELNRRIAMEQHSEVMRRDSESSLTDGSTIRQPHWTHAKPIQVPSSRPNSRPSSRQNSRPNSRQQLPVTHHISAQRQQDLNRLSHQSASSSLDDSDDDMRRRQPMERNIYSEGGDSSSDESSNDSFTASEFEADEPKVRNDYQPSNMMFTKLQEVEDESDTGDPNAYRTTFSWDGLRNVDTSLQRFINNSDSNTDLDSVTKDKIRQQSAFRWDHFLSWGPNFEKLVGVFSDIAELPQDQTDDIDIQSTRSSEYV